MRWRTLRSLRGGSLSGGAVLTVLALGYWWSTGKPWPLVAALCALLVVVAILELRDLGWRQTALRRSDLNELVPLARPEVVEGMGGQVTLGAESLFQDDYAALLIGDLKRFEQFDLRRGQQVLGEDRRREAWFCKRCHLRAAIIRVHHPIWDGPFEGGGSGRVDAREFPWCFSDDPRLDMVELGAVYQGARYLERATGDVLLPGRAVRLPWLGGQAIRLRSELFERPAFHNLLIRVEKAPPLPPAPSRLPHVWVNYAEGARADRDRCEVCGQTAAGTLHQPHAYQDPGPTVGSAAAGKCATCNRDASDPIHVLPAALPR